MYPSLSLLYHTLPFVFVRLPVNLKMEIYQVVQRQVRLRFSQAQAVLCYLLLHARQGETERMLGRPQYPPGVLVQ